MPTTRAQHRHQDATNHLDFNSKGKIESAAGLGSRRQSTKPAAGSFQPDECASSLLTLPTEIRLQIYEYLLHPEFCIDAKEEAFARPDDLLIRYGLLNELDNMHSDASDENADGMTDDISQKERSECKLANRGPPNRKNRKTYSQLLLVCKTIHHEAAPLFFSKATFFIREPFRFGNTFLRKLAQDKIYSLRHLELRMAISSLDVFRPRKPEPWARASYNLLKLFETYHKELGGLDSVILTLVVTGSMSPTTLDSDIFFGPRLTHSLPWWTGTPAVWIWDTAQALARVMKTTDFQLFKTEEEIYEKVPDSRAVIPIGAATRVKLQRTGEWRP